MLTKTHHQIDITDVNTATNIVDWCLENLEEPQWEIQLLRMFPPAYRFKFTCDNNKILAMLNS